MDGEFAGAVNRVPAPDDLRSNMVRGGVPKETELTPREREICARLAAPLRERGLLFVGIDVIDGYLTEINVTSPTGIRAIKNLGGPDVAAMIWDRIERTRGAAELSIRRKVVSPTAFRSVRRSTRAPQRNSPPMRSPRSAPSRRG